MGKKKPYNNADDLMKDLVINKDHVTQFAASLYLPFGEVDKAYLSDLFRKLKDKKLLEVLFTGDNKVYHVRITPDGFEYAHQLDKINWKRAVEMFVLLHGKCRDDLLEIVKRFPQDSVIPQGSEFEESVEILRTKGYLSRFEVFVNGAWGVSYTYDDLHYRLLEEDYLANRRGSSTLFSIEGGSHQINVANDNATIHATQNNGVDTSKLAELIKALQENSKELSPEDRQSLDTSIEFIQSELTSDKPKKNIITFATKALQAISGSVEFLAAVATLVQFIQTITSTLN